MMKKQFGSKKQQGFVLISAMIFVVVVGALLIAASTSSLSNRRIAGDNNRTVRTQLLAEAGIEQTIVNYFNTPMANLLKADRNLAQYKLALNSLGFTNTSSKTVTGSLDGGNYSTTIQRKDGVNQITLLVSSKGTDANGSTRVIAQDFYVSGGKFKGFDYAVLSNNANCIFCHSQIDTTEAAYGTGTNPATGTNRAKVGMLESLQMRVGSADSIVGGSIYSRGNFTNEKGATVTNPAGTTLDSWAIDGTSGKIASNTRTDLSQQDCITPNTCTANGNFYKNYPKGQGPDGDLPDSFPMPIPDSNSNKVMDTTEWNAALANECVGGTLSGGNIQSFARSATPSTVGTSVTSISSGTVGHYVIDARTNPITVNGTVCVDGDVIILGKVKGTGKIIARENIYVTGDVEYACGGDNHVCTNTDRQVQTNLPKFGMAAGGNIMLGDYLSPRSGSAAAITTASSLDTGVTGSDMNFSFAEMAVFNRKERDKSLSVSGYVPRYYVRKDGDPIIYYTGTGEAPSKWGGTDIATITDATLMANAVSLNPTASSTDKKPWRSEAQIKQMWIDNMETPVRSGTDCNNTKAFTIDGLLYSSNAIYAMTRSKSKTAGQITVNGSIIAADTGILTPGNNSTSCRGLRVHYDQRLKELFNLNSTDNVVLLKSNYRLVKQQ